MRWLKSILEWIKNIFAKKTMRRKITLYIGGNPADLDDQSFILFNYAMEDLSNPTIVKNSYTQQITLQGTPANNAIFGDFFRVDRAVDYNSGESGAGFNPSRKTPFSIYNELGEILESGYCKLDEVIRTDKDISYKVTLYGGLGSFLYSLSYDDAGKKLTLADIDFLGNGDDAELDFTINATAVTDAWARLNGDTSKSAIWDIINFAPAYNGYPDNFSPEKGLISLPGAGLPDDVGGYHSKSGYGLVNMSEKQDEWAVKDLRSYLQRPVLSMKAFLEAICSPSNNGGYVVDITDINTTPFFLYMWMTLPTIPSLGSAKQYGGGLSLTMSSSATTGNDVGNFTIGGSVPFGSVVNANIRCKLRFNMPSAANTYNTLTTSARYDNYAHSTIIFLQVVALASDNTIVGGSAVKMIGGSFTRSPKEVATACGWTPAYPTDRYEYFDAGNAEKISSGVFELANELSFNVEAQDAATFVLKVNVFSCSSTLQRGEWHHTYSGNGSSSRATLYASYSTYYQAATAFIVNGSGNTISMTLSSALRSGARITKQMLLSTSGTPADYLLSLCKMCGFYFVTDNAEKKVTILRRNTLFQDETIDLTDRVDLSKDITIQPLVFDSKWYKFSQEGIGGAFYDEYRSIEGIDYGIQLIDTGFDFNADVKDLLDTSVFKNACTILQRSRYWNIIESGVTFIPSPFLDTGNTITRWNDNNETQDTPISCPPSTASVTYYNDTYNGYDLQTGFKCQFADASGKQLDGKDVLLFLNRFDYYERFKVTDDLPVMSVVNDGKPCWILDEGAGVDIPIFRRYYCEYRYSKYNITRSLDFGVPRQLDIPSVVYKPESTIYSKCWRDYLVDRYDVDTRVMRCMVHFDGIKVSQDLLRKFYYYDNCIWVLNAIRNYSLTTYDAVECEFIKVKDKENYLNGQGY